MNRRPGQTRRARDRRSPIFSQRWLSRRDISSPIPSRRSRGSALLVFDGDFLFFDEWNGFGLIERGVPLLQGSEPAGALANHWGSAQPSLRSRLSARAAASGGAAAANGFSGLHALALAGCRSSSAIAAILGALSILSAPESALAPRSRDRRSSRSGPRCSGTRCDSHSARTWRASSASECSCSRSPAWRIAPDAPTFSPASSRPGDRHADPARHARPRRRAPPGRRGPPLALGARRRGRGVSPSPSGDRMDGGIRAAPRPAGLRSGPLGGTWMAFGANALAESLFSSYHGLLPWAPIFALAIAGWSLELRRAPARRRRCSLCSLAEWVANGLLRPLLLGRHVVRAAALRRSRRPLR